MRFLTAALLALVSPGKNKKQQANALDETRRNTQHATHNTQHATHIATYQVVIEAEGGFIDFENNNRVLNRIEQSKQGPAFR